MSAIPNRSTPAETNMCFACSMFTFSSNVISPIMVSICLSYCNKADLCCTFCCAQLPKRMVTIAITRIVLNLIPFIVYLFQNFLPHFAHHFVAVIDHRTVRIDSHKRTVLKIVCWPFGLSRSRWQAGPCKAGPQRGHIF